MTTYTYRTDAVSSPAEYETEEAAIAAAVESGDWAQVDTSAERALIRDGGWLCIYQDGVPEMVRGEMA